MAIRPVILAGGSGTRLWPLSRRNHPKQFLDLLDSGQTLLQSTIDRARACSDQPPLIVGHVDHRFLISHQISEKGLTSSNVLLEPMSRNTAASVAAACFKVAADCDDDWVLVMPSDHYFEDNANLSFVVDCMARRLKQQQIGLFGVKPRSPSCDYGYFEFDPSVVASPVIRFIEKPAEEIAKSLIQNQNCHWNSGMLLAKATTLLTSISQLAPDLYSKAKASYESQKTIYDFCLLGDDFKDIESVAFDVAILEKHQDVVATFIDQQWDDLGTWSNLITRRQALNLEKVNVFSESGKALVYGLDDVVLVEGDDIVFAAHQDSLLDMKKLTEYLQLNNLTSLLNRIDVHRPWGQFKVLGQDAHFIVKRLLVYPNSQISLQSHRFRSEHWVVTKGVADVLVEGEQHTLTVGESICINKHQKHRLMNNSEEPVEIIEVQTGDQLSEDDIIRYDDSYERHLNI